MLKKICLIIFTIVFGAAVFTACNGGDVGTQSGGQGDGKPTTYTLSQSSLTLERGNSYQLTVFPSPKGETVLWESSNAEIATVSMGEVYAKSVGDATVTMKIGEAEYACAVKVIDLVVKNATITLPRYTASVPVGTEETIKAELIVNDEILTETVTWTVESVTDGVISEADYTVNGNKITLRYGAVGTVTITASYGDTEATYTVFVAPETREKLPTPTNLTVNKEIITWTAVQNATKYGVKIAGYSEEIVTGTSFTNGEILRQDGAYEVSVRAIAEPTSTYLDGEYSKSVKVKCQFMMLYEDTTDEGVDFIKFTPANGEVESYALFVNGEEQKTVRAGEEIPVIEYGEASLYVVAKMASGGIQKTREITFVNDSQTTVQSLYGGNGVAGMETTGLPAGATASALKLSVFPSSDSSYQAGVHNVEFEDVKVGAIISYRIYVTNITTNLYDKRGDWENGKQEETEVPISRLVRLSGVNGNTPSIPGAKGAIQKDTWYTVYTTASARADNGKMDFSTYLASWQNKTERHYAYTMYIDRICVGVKLESDSDTDNTVSKGSFGFDGLSMTVEKETENVYGDSLAAIKVTTAAGPYKTASGYLTSQTLFGDLEANDVVSYYIKAVSVQTSSTKDGTYSPVTKIKTSELLTPSGFGGFPMEITTATGEAVANEVTVGEWYKVSYVTTGVSNDTNNTTFKYCAYKSGRMNLYQYCSTAFMKTEFVIDGITVTKGVDDFEKSVLFGGVGIDNLSMTTAKETETTYGDSVMAVRVLTEAGIYKTCSGTLTSTLLFGTLKAGDTISYYIQAASVQTSTTQKIADRTYTAQTTILAKELLNPQAWGAIPTALTKADGTAVSNDAVTGEEVLTVGEWYKVTYVATGIPNDQDNTTFKRIGYNSGKACFMQYCTTAFMRAEFIIDGITVKNL